MQKLTITKVFATDEKKDGTKIVNKFGKPYFRVGLKAEQYGEEWLSGFLPTKPDWEGKEVELEITEEEFGGKMQKKFSVPKKEGKVAEDIAVIKRDLTTILLILRNIDANTQPKNKIHYPTADEEGIDISKTFPDDDYSDSVPLN